VALKHVTICENHLLILYFCVFKNNNNNNNNYYYYYITYYFKYKISKCLICASKILFSNIYF